MLTLTEDQYQTFRACDRENYIGAIADLYLAKRPELLADPGRSEVVSRMRGAMDLASSTGIPTSEAVLQMMYLAVRVPGIWDNPIIGRYLSKPGQPPAARLDDLLATMRRQMQIWQEDA